MAFLELRNVDESRRFLLEGLWLQKLHAPTPETVRPVLEWVLEITASGAALPPLGVISDIGKLVFGDDGSAPQHAEMFATHWEPGLMRAYEDHVLGRLATDSAFERAAAAVDRYQGRDRNRGLSFLLEQFAESIGFQGITLNPAVVKSLLQQSPRELLAEGWQSLCAHGTLHFMPRLYSQLITAVRQSLHVLTPADVFELEYRTALAEFSHRIALRQVVQAAAALEEALPRTWPRRQAPASEVATFLREEATYPVGGFSSISTRGSMESLLHSQLAYMEQGNRPDLFDVKFLRDELLYYSRDEGEYFRRRRTFIVALFPEMSEGRVKDPELTWQRIVLFLALLLIAVRKLPESLNRDSLKFEFLFVRLSAHDADPAEKNLLETLMRGPIETGTVAIHQISGDQLESHVGLVARRSDCRCLLAGTRRHTLEVEGAHVASLQLGQRRPVFDAGSSHRLDADVESPLDAWSEMLKELLEFWG